MTEIPGPTELPLFVMIRQMCRSIWLLLAGFLLLAGACSSTSDDTAPATDDVEEAPSTTDEETEDPETSDSTTTSEVADPEPASLDVEAQVSAIAAAAAPLGDVIGASRPAGEDPTTELAESFERLCPAVVAETPVVVQSDPLVENFPVQRHIVLFDTPDEAAGFAAEVEETGGPGCVAERETEVSVATTTVDDLTILDLDGMKALELTAQVDVDLTNIERDPPGAQVRRYLAVEGNAVIVVVALATYEDLVGVDVMEPLLLDGIELVKTAS